jgi:hypothetical protein
LFTLWAMTQKKDIFCNFSWQISSVYYGTADLRPTSREEPLKPFARIRESAPRNARNLAQNPFFYFTPEIEGSVWMMIRYVHLSFAQRARQSLNSNFQYARHDIYTYPGPLKMEDSNYDWLEYEEEHEQGPVGPRTLLDFCQGGKHSSVAGLTYCSSC